MLLSKRASRGTTHRRLRKRRNFRRATEFPSPAGNSVALSLDREVVAARLPFAPLVAFSLRDVARTPPAPEPPRVALTETTARIPAIGRWVESTTVPPT